MKVKVPSKTVDVCDICNRESMCLEKCIVCGQEYCLICRGILIGCMIPPEICKVCDDREDVKTVVAKYSPRFAEIDKARDKALAQLKSP